MATNSINYKNKVYVMFEEGNVTGTTQNAAIALDYMMEDVSHSISETKFLANNYKSKGVSKNGKKLGRSFKDKPKVKAVKKATKKKVD